MLVIHGEAKHGEYIYVPSLSPKKPPWFTPLVKRRFHPYLHQEVGSQYVSLIEQSCAGYQILSSRDDVNSSRYLVVSHTYSFLGTIWRAPQGGGTFAPECL